MSISVKELRMFLDKNNHDITRFACFMWFKGIEEDEKPVMQFSDVRIHDMYNIRDYFSFLIEKFEEDPSCIQYKVDE